MRSLKVICLLGLVGEVLEASSRATFRLRSEVSMECSESLLLIRGALMSSAGWGEEEEDEAQSLDSELSSPVVAVLVAEGCPVGLPSLTRMGTAMRRAEEPLPDEELVVLADCICFSLS